METEPPPLIKSSAGQSSGRSLVEDVVHLVEDGKNYLDAELQYQKSRAGVVGSGARKAAVLAAFGFAFALLALLAMTVGLLLALAPVLGVWLAMLVVTLGLLGCAGGCALAARGKWRAAMQHLDDVRKAPAAAVEPASE
jgi:fatty acid desaturase